jgi:hypothetical protein
LLLKEVIELESGFRALHVMANKLFNNATFAWGFISSAETALRARQQRSRSGTTAL